MNESTFDEKVVASPMEDTGQGGSDEGSDNDASTFAASAGSVPQAVDTDPVGSVGLATSETGQPSTVFADDMIGVADEAAPDTEHLSRAENPLEPGSSAHEDQGEPGRGAAGGMQTLLKDYGDEYVTPQRGDILEGTIVRIDKDGIMVDIGTKSEGIVPPHEALNIINNPDEHLQVGDEVLVFVVQPENQNGHVVLSLNRARAEKGWRMVQKQFEEGNTIEAEVTDFNRGGLIVNISGVRGFVPMSQAVGLRHNGASDAEVEQRMGAMVGRSLKLKVIEVNRSRNRLILSERAAMQEIRTQRKDQLLAELNEGEIRHGRVSSICDFGAFVDLGGADGLVHLSELSWSQVSHPREVVKVGDEVDVYVIGVDREKKKIALSLRRGQPGPWSKIGERYKAGDLVTGVVTKLASFGAFARIEDGVEGLIHVSELGEGRVPHPKNVVKEGDQLTLRILRIDPERRRLGLSLKRALHETADRPKQSDSPSLVSMEPTAADAAGADQVQSAQQGDPGEVGLDRQDD